MRRFFAFLSVIIVIVFFSGNSTNVYAAGSYKVTFNANGGTGEMGTAAFSTTSVSTLPANKYTRTGYRFRGWNTSSDGTGVGYADQGSVMYTGVDNLKLYASWEPQVFKISFDGNGATSGSMNDQLISYDQTTSLRANAYTKDGYTFAGWVDNSGNVYANGQAVSNLRKCNMRSTKLKTISAGKPSVYTNYSFKSVQGSTVFTQNSHRYVVFAASINDASYYAGDLSHYETNLVKYDLTAGKTVAQVHNLWFDHGNALCYNTDNGHIYIAEGGTRPGYASDIMEVDSNLNYVTTHHIEGVKNVYAIAYYNGAYYVMGKNDNGKACFFLVNYNFEIAGWKDVSANYQQGYCIQGMTVDGNFIYALTACFDAYNWKGNQKVNVFTMSGDYAGTWSIDISKEVEDISIDPSTGKIYVSTNEGSKTTVYETVFPNVTLHASWVKN